MGSGTRKIRGRSFGDFLTRASTKGESIRVFPLSNWTELDIWLYIHMEKIPIVPLYFARDAESCCVAELCAGHAHMSCCRARNAAAVVRYEILGVHAVHGGHPFATPTPFRKLSGNCWDSGGGAGKPAIDHDEEGSMELKKREGYF